MGAEGPNVAYEVEGDVAVVRLDRPERLNAFTFGMVGEIRAAVERAVADEAVVGIVVTGTGRGFCAGLDAGDLARSTDGDVPLAPPSDPEEAPALFAYLPRVPKPVLAAVNGPCAGGGFVLAMMCDLRFAAEGATFTTAFSRRGLIAEHGTSWLLPRLVGTGRALDLLWSARRFDAAEAHRVGFVDRVVPGEALVDEARAYVADLAANVSPRSLAVMKSQVYRGWSTPFVAACQEADALATEALAHPDAKEGLASFVERRPPRFARWRGEGA